MLAIKSHQPFGLGWFSVEFLFFAPLVSTNSGFNPLGKGLPLTLPPPQGPGGKGRHGGTVGLYCVFGHLVALQFFVVFFDAFWDRLLVDVLPQLGSPNPQKSVKNRCQDAFPC